MIKPFLSFLIILYIMLNKTPMAIKILVLFFTNAILNSISRTIPIIRVNMPKTINTNEAVFKDFKIVVFLLLLCNINQHLY